MNNSVLSATTTTTLAPPTPAEEPDRTIPQVCAKRKISLSTYYDLRRKGYGPRERRYPDSPIVRITAEAEREWDLKLEELQQTEDAQLERERRIEQRKAAGKKAAKSMLHVSNAGPRTAAGRAAAAKKCRQRG